MTSQEKFATIQSSRISRSVFDRSHGHKTTFDAFGIYPIFIDEALPGDTLKCNPTVFGRLATPLKPIMDNIYLDVHFFSVPYRLVWDNWIYFMGEGNRADGPTPTGYTIPQGSPQAASGGYDSLSIQDYFGLPIEVEDFTHSELPLRAYNLIWNEWYRDEDLLDPLVVPTGDAGNTEPFTIRPRGKKKDYFTSARPWAQKGTTPNLLDATNYPIVFDSDSGADRTIARDASDTALSSVDFLTTSWQTNSVGNLQGNNPTAIVSMDVSANHYADLSNIELTINQFRQYTAIQHLLEKDARGGTRYPELIHSHFGVISPDARLQRPEYLGGTSTPLGVNPIAQNSATEDSLTPQGNLAAMGIFSMSGKGFTKTFTEHEIVIGLISTRSDLNYQQGLNRMWSRESKYDFYWPSLEGLGEQAILNKEIYCDGTSADEDVFGYQERFSEYKYKPSQITGLFRSQAAQSLDIWHVAQDFSSRPSLNYSFYIENPGLERCLAVTDEPEFIVDCYFNYQCARPMKTYSTPGLSRL